MDVLARLDQARAANNILEHPFYRRWSAGKLGASELSCYAGEYRHAVIALADACALAAAKATPADAPLLRAHAAEEAAHVAMWDEFARATGARPEGGAEALAETETCVQAWTQGEDLLEHLAVLYAIEASQPEVARTKLDGLTAHYGYSSEGPAVVYFTTHEQRDLEHAREGGALIEGLMADEQAPEEKAERMVSRAEAALRGNQVLLDGVERCGGR
ncbi:MAG TPA: iron-containing redox enzyme family protein [Solirubrobacteraceae bacterium]|jgi:pyrroloquinoline-quinone synthase|nr:iron-containing redox enzyme family protein [Solirubrobacteraceae bacterium]